METRLFNGIELRSIDKENRTIEFVASDASKDSHGTVLLPGNWDLERFNKNGVIGYQHAMYWGDDPDDVIGKGQARVEDEQLIVKVTFEPADLNRKADKIFRKLEFGSLKAVSVGFIPRGGHYGEGAEAADGADPTYFYDSQELLEISIVNIPSNKNALKRAIEELEEGPALHVGDAGLRVDIPNIYAGAAGSSNKIEVTDGTGRALTMAEIASTFRPEPEVKDSNDEEESRLEEESIIAIAEAEMEMN